MVWRLKWLVGLLLLASFHCAGAAEPAITFQKRKIELSYKKIKKVVTVEVAQTPAQHAQGLMYRKHMNAQEGMLFIFSDEQTREFWMKNTWIPLDIAYFGKDKVMIEVQRMAPVTSMLQQEVPTYPSRRPAQYALEMNAGWFRKNGFAAGTTFQLLAGP